MKTIALRALASFLLLWLAGSALACDGADCGTPEKWSSFDSITLTLSVPGEAGSTTTRGRFDRKAHDIRVEVEGPGDKAGTERSIAMVGGRVLLAKGVALERGHEIAALDAPVVSMQLVLRLLERVFPDGPRSVLPEKRIDHTDAVAIEYSTASAGVRIAAPWHLAGKVAGSAKGPMTYDLLLTFQGEGPSGEVAPQARRMAGELAVAAGPVFRDDASIEGWTVHGAAGEFHTIGDVRAYIARASGARGAR